MQNAAATPAAGADANPYGLFQALHEGGVISWSVFIILVLFSIGTFYILFTKLIAAAEDHQPGPAGPRELLELAEPSRSRDQAREDAAPIARSSTTPSSRRTSTAS